MRLFFFLPAICQSKEVYQSEYEVSAEKHIMRRGVDDRTSPIIVQIERWVAVIAGATVSIQPAPH
jgi:hypothetical protein